MKLKGLISFLLDAEKISNKPFEHNFLRQRFGRLYLLWAILPAAVFLMTQNVCANLFVSTWVVDGGDENVAVACSAVSGWYAIGDTFDDNIEVRNSSHDLIRKITRSEIDALLPHFAKASESSWIK